MEIENKKSVISSWVNLYADSMFSYALYRTSGKETAEDLVQETFMAAIQGFEKYEGLSNPKTWLFSILNHKILDYHRNNYRNKTNTENPDSEWFFNDAGKWKTEERPAPWNDDTGNLLDDEDFNDVLQKCMKKLPSSWYSVIQLKYMQEKKGEQICQELGIAPTNLWQILHRAKLELRKCIETNWFNKTEGIKNDR